MSSQELSVIILTLNEEIHLRRCLESVSKIIDNLFIVDCFSTDRTVEIAKEHGAEVFQNNWPGLQSIQFNWALENLPIETKWVLRLDADEYLTDELISEIGRTMQCISEDVSGIILRRRHIFLGKWVKHGVYPVKLLRLFRYNHGHCEQRFMDEHIKLKQGKTIEFEHDFVDHNLNDLGWWTKKHADYAVREAIDLLDTEFNLAGSDREINSAGLVGQAASKRKVKSLYLRLPLFLRPFLYFIYRYFLRLGFLDGKAGFLWHFLQGWWYRTLVDARIWEVKKACGKDREKIRQYVREKFGYEI